MSFEMEKKLFWVIILAAIPLNPTNVLVDMIQVVILDNYSTFNMFGWLLITFVLVAKIILAVMELEALTEIWNIFFKRKSK